MYTSAHNIIIINRYVQPFYYAFKKMKNHDHHQWLCTTILLYAVKKMKNHGIGIAMHCILLIFLFPRFPPFSKKCCPHCSFFFSFNATGTGFLRLFVCDEVFHNKKTRSTPLHNQYFLRYHIFQYLDVTTYSCESHVSLTFKEITYQTNKRGKEKKCCTKKTASPTYSIFSLITTNNSWRRSRAASPRLFYLISLLAPHSWKRDAVATPFFISIRHNHIIPIDPNTICAIILNQDPSLLSLVVLISNTNHNDLP